MKIVIIGAGPAGLTAALEALRQLPSCHVLVLDENPQVGGISRTIRYHGRRMDLGGHRFFTKEDRVQKWWNELLPPQGQADPEQTDAVMLRRCRVSRIFWHGRFFDYPVRLNAATLKAMGLRGGAAAGCSYLHSVLRKLPESSLENFYINRFGRRLYEMFFEGYTEKLWGLHPREISADWGAQRVKGLSIAAVLKNLLPSAKKRSVETSLIEEFDYPKYGPGQLWEEAAKRIEALGGEIRLNCKVTRLERMDGRIRRIWAEGSDTPFEADIVLSSMPLKDLAQALDDVPSSLRSIAEALPYRDYVTVGMLLPTLAIRNETGLKTEDGLIPDCWMYVQDPGVRLGRIQVFNNWSPYLLKPGEKGVWLGLEYFCSEGDEAWQRSEEEWAEFALKELRQMGLIDKGTRWLDVHRERVKKAYPAYFGSYGQLGELIRYLDGIPELYCIGRNGQHRYNNMDHSMMTAFEAVKHIAGGGGGSREAIWAVNAEQSYHEEKS